MIVKRFGCIAIHNKALYKCFIHSFIHSFRLKDQTVLNFILFVIFTNCFVVTTQHAGLYQLEIIGAKWSLKSFSVSVYGE